MLLDFLLLLSVHDAQHEKSHPASKKHGIFHAVAAKEKGPSRSFNKPHCDNVCNQYTNRPTACQGRSLGYLTSDWHYLSTHQSAHPDITTSTLVFSYALTKLLSTVLWNQSITYLIAASIYLCVKLADSCTSKLSEETTMAFIRCKYFRRRQGTAVGYPSQPDATHMIRQEICRLCSNTFYVKLILKVLACCNSRTLIMYSICCSFTHSIHFLDAV